MAWWTLLILHFIYVVKLGFLGKQTWLKSYSMLTCSIKNPSMKCKQNLDIFFNALKKL